MLSPPSGKMQGCHILKLPTDSFSGGLETEWGRFSSGIFYSWVWSDLNRQLWLCTVSIIVSPSLSQSYPISWTWDQLGSESWICLLVVAARPLCALPATSPAWYTSLTGQALFSPVWWSTPPSASVCTWIGRWSVSCLLNSFCAGDIFMSLHGVFL